jgi:hypothetical protein
MARLGRSNIFVDDRAFCSIVTAQAVRKRAALPSGLKKSPLMSLLPLPTGLIKSPLMSLLPLLTGLKIVKKSSLMSFLPLPTGLKNSPLMPPPSAYRTKEVCSDVSPPPSKYPDPHISV